jgi:hypothetical protein
VGRWRVVECWGGLGGGGGGAGGGAGIDSTRIITQHQIEV